MQEPRASVGTNAPAEGGGGKEPGLRSGVELEREE